MLYHKTIKSFFSVFILFIVFSNARAQNKLEIEKVSSCDLEKLTNSEGKKIVSKNFRPQETYQLHGGKTIYIIEDKPPVIVEEKKNWFVSMQRFIRASPISTVAPSLIIDERSKLDSLPDQTVIRADWATVW